MDCRARASMPRVPTLIKTTLNRFLRLGRLAACRASRSSTWVRSRANPTARSWDAWCGARCLTRASPQWSSRHLQDAGGGSRVAIQLDRTDSSGHGWPTCGLRIVRRPGSGLVQHGSLIGGQFRAGGRTRRVRQGSNPAGQTFRADGRYDRKRRGRPAGKRHGLLQMPVQPSFTARMA